MTQNIDNENENPSFDWWLKNFSHLLLIFESSSSADHFRRWTKISLLSPSFVIIILINVNEEGFCIHSPIVSVSLTICKSWFVCRSVSQPTNKKSWFVSSIKRNLSIILMDAEDKDKSQDKDVEFQNKVNRKWMETHTKCRRSLLTNCFSFHSDSYRRAIIGVSLLSLLSLHLHLLLLLEFPFTEKKRNPKFVFRETNWRKQLHKQRTFNDDLYSNRSLFSTFINFLPFFTMQNAGQCFEC